MEEVLIKVLDDKKLVESLSKAPTLEEAKKVLNEKGIEATNEDMQVLGNVFAAAAEKGKELNENDLSNVVGGISKANLKKYVGRVAAVLATAGVATYLGKKWYDKKQAIDDDFLDLLRLEL